MAAGLVCGAYARFYPIFQGADESNHYDYALTLRTAMRPVRADEGAPQNDTHPSVRYLLSQTGGAGLRLDPLARVPAGYGTQAFYDALDRGAPQVDVEHFRNGPISPVPYLTMAYPLGYYSLAAFAIAIGEHVAGDGVVAQFFCARAFSVLSFLATLVFTWLLLGELRVRPRLGLALLAFTGFLPMALQTFASVQPDDLVSALITAILWLAMLARRRRFPIWTVVTIAFLLAVLCATKRHYWVVVTIPVLLAFVASGRIRSRIARVVVLVAPALAAYFATQPYLTESPPVAGAALCRGPFEAGLQQSTLAGIRSFLDSALLGGQSSQRFWISFGWYGKPLVVVNGTVTAAILTLLTIGELVLFVMLLIVLARNATRLVRIVRQRSPATAFRLATANIAFNAYALYALVLFAVIPRFGGGIGLQGRYWLPFLPVIWYTAVVLAPRALPRGWRWGTRRILVVAIGAVIVAVNLAAPSAIRNRFYAEWPERGAHPADEVYAVFLTPAGRTNDAHFAGSGSDAQLSVRGIVVDLRNAAPSRDVQLRLDGTTVIHTKPLAVPGFACNNVELSLVDSGFEAQIPLHDLAPGAHTLSVWTKTPWSPDPIETAAHGALEIAR